VNECVRSNSAGCLHVGVLALAGILACNNMILAHQATSYHASYSLIIVCMLCAQQGYRLWSPADF
jgi:hypothetical protein